MLPPHKTLLAQIAACEALAEKAYDAMYDSRHPAAEYSDLKDYFAEAIGLARRAGLTAEAERLSARLAHCKAVYRSQFSQSLRAGPVARMSGAKSGAICPRR